MKNIIIGFLSLITLILFAGGFYVSNEKEIVVLTRFSKPVAYVTDAGWHWKTPFVTDASTRFSKQLLEWDGAAVELPTRDKLSLVVDSFARWRIAQPEVFFKRLGNERTADSRLDDIISSELRSVIASNNLVEIVRSDVGRKANSPDMAKETLIGGDLAIATFGRRAIEDKVFSSVKDKVNEFGIELVSFGIKRSCYSPSIAEKIDSRMSAEREQAAQVLEQQGKTESEKILAAANSDAANIMATASTEAAKIRSDADASVAKLYRSVGEPAKVNEFLAFTRGVEAIEKAVGPKTTIFIDKAHPISKALKGEK